jgi:Uma2 family endonuclease
MSADTSSATLVEPVKMPDTGFVALQDFLLNYANREDPYKYEWNGGIIEKKPRTMTRDQLYLLQKLSRLFHSTKAFAEMGELTSEVDMFLPLANRTRRPDIAYLSGEQMQASKDGRPTVCSFVIEIISRNDQVNNLEEKKAEYFANGVQVLWIIFPQMQKVEVYRSIKEVNICTGNDRCSAAPVLPDFEISVHDLFQA